MSNNIKKFRKEQGYTLIELANKVGISSGYLCHLENGSRKNPSINIMEKIALVLQQRTEKLQLFQIMMIF